MFEKWFVDPSSIRNVERDGEKAGFSISVKPPHYRGVRLSLVDIIRMKLDGQPVATGTCYSP